jgi:hypothetical protein
MHLSDTNDRAHIGSRATKEQLRLDATRQLLRFGKRVGGGGGGGWHGRCLIGGQRSSKRVVVYFSPLSSSYSSVARSPKPLQLDGQPGDGAGHPGASLSYLHQCVKVGHQPRVATW